jgi:RNA polymerase sigma-70 factor (ECF subfamily)
MSHETPVTLQLLRQARQGDTAALGRLFEFHRDSLRNLAERQLQGRVAARVDASDIVQQTFLDAHRHFEQFAGEEEAELLSWLRSILNQHVAGVIRHHALLQKRSVQREQPLDAYPGDHPATAQELAASHSTPSQRVMRGEDEDRLNRALATLPEDQQRAVRLRHLEGKSLAEIAELMGRSRTATAGLLKRGMHALRRQLGNTD